MAVGGSVVLHEAGDELADRVSRFAVGIGLLQQFRARSGYIPPPSFLEEEMKVHAPYDEIAAEAIESDEAIKSDEEAAA